MTESTLPQLDELCRELALDAIAESDRGLSLAEIVVQVHGTKRATTRELRAARIRAAVLELEADGQVDWEYSTRCGTRRYFLAATPPRMRVTWVAAVAVPRLDIAPRTWFSALGMAA